VNQTFKPVTGFSMFPPVIKALLILNTLIFAVEMLSGQSMTNMLALWPLGTPEMAMSARGLIEVPGFMPWQVLTYGFLHANLMHLGLNLFALWMFGVAIENAWGSQRFLVYFLTCVIGAGLIQLGVTSYQIASGGNIYPTVGASGGVFGILLAFGMMFPNQRIMLLFPPVPMKAKWFVLGFGALTLFFGVTGTMSGIAHFAHLGGMLFGLLLILYWRGQLPLRPRRIMRW